MLIRVGFSSASYCAVLLPFYSAAYTEIFVDNCWELTFRFRTAEPLSSNSTSMWFFCHKYSEKPEMNILIDNFLTFRSC